MGLLDILKAIPMAAGEKARADEFGPDYRQRWQKYQDEHVRGELQNAISTTSLNATRSKLAAEAAARMKAYPGMSEGDAYSQQIADEYGRDVEGKTLDISGKRQGQEFAAEDQGFERKLFPGKQQTQEVTLTGAGTRNEREQIELDRIKKGLPPVPPDPNRGMGMLAPWIPGKDPSGGIEGFYDKAGTWHDVQPPTGPGGPRARTAPVPQKVFDTLSHFDAAETALDKLESSIARVNAVSGYRHPLDKLMATSQLSADTSGLASIALGRAMGESRFTDQDRAVYAREVAPALNQLTTLTLGTGEQQLRINTIRAFIAKMKDKAESNFTERYGVAPPGGSEDEIPVRLRGMTSPKGTRYKATAVEGGKMYISDGTPGGWAEVK